MHINDRRITASCQIFPATSISGASLLLVFGLARRGSTIGFHLLWHTVSTRLCLSQWLDFYVFALMHWVERLSMNRIFMYFRILRVASGPRVKLAGRKSALNPGWFTLLTVCCFVVYSTMRYVLCLTLCYSVLVFFSSFSIAITSLGEERVNLSAFRMFVRFALVWFCLFPLPLGVWDGLRFVIVALPGLFSYLFCINSQDWDTQ